MNRLTVFTFTFILALAIPQLTFSQSKEKDKKSTIQGENVLDMQTNLYKDFMIDSTANPNTIHGFLDLVNQSELTPVQKKQAQDLYKKYTAEESSGKKDSLQQVVLKMMKAAEKPTNQRPKPH